MALQPPARSASVRTPRAAATVLAVAAVLAFVAGPATAQPDDTVEIVKEEENLTNAEIAARLTEETFARSTTVLIGREDVFADSMAAAPLQADAPLLLVPPAGPIPQRTLDLLGVLDAQRAVLLGGEAALAPVVEEQLEDAGLEIERRAGASRIETAIDIAETDVAAADTAILARAFPAPGSGDATQAFADALAAGGLAARSRWPILLTQTEVLTGSTRAYLQRSGLERVEVMGGTAAISDAVVDELESLGLEVERIAGANRFETAVEVADKLGDETAADAARIVLVEGEGEDAWAAGFASAAHAAVFDAPIVLAGNGGLPPTTAEWLSAEVARDGAYAQAEPVDDRGVRLVCVTVPETCAEAREALGLVAAATFTFDPVTGSEVQPGQAVSATIDPGDEAVSAVRAEGTCLAAPVEEPFTAAGSVSADVSSDAAAGECAITWTLVFATGSEQADTVDYVVVPPAPPDPPDPPDPQVTGTVTRAPDPSVPEAYSYVADRTSSDDTITEADAPLGAGDVYLVDGRAADVGSFAAAASVADRVTITFHGDGTRTHALTEVDPATISSGTVGNVVAFFSPTEQAAVTFDIIEPVSGVALRSDVDAGTAQSFTIDGATATLNDVLFDLSEGDAVALGPDGALDLTNGAASGEVADVATDPDGTFVTFRALNGGKLDSPGLGDKPSTTTDDLFVVRSATSSDQAFTIDGQPAGVQDFLASLDAGDGITYSRVDDVELFALADLVVP